MRRINRYTMGAAALAIAVASLTGVGVVTGAGAAGDDHPYVVTVRVTNLAPATGTIQTPVWVAVHDGTFDTYDSGAPASAALERLAEDGNTGPISTLFAATGSGQDATLFGPGGPVFPGDTATGTFIVDGKDADARYFSYASMVIPSNDAFISNGNPMAHRLFDADGNFIGSDFVVLGNTVLDAGTEVNDEIPENTAALAQAAPDTGVVEGGTVGAHAGFLPGGNVLAAIPAGDFTAPGYEAALIELEARPLDLRNRNLYGVLEGSQEVPAVDSRSLGYVVLELRGTGTFIKVNTQWWNTSDVVAAHLHLGAAGENGPVVATLFSGTANGPANGDAADGRITAASLSGPFEGMPLSVLYDALDQGEIYINVHTVANPSGEMRGQIVP